MLLELRSKRYSNYTSLIGVLRLPDCSVNYPEHKHCVCRQAELVPALVLALVLATSRSLV
jgi:hypothetical protein